MASFSGGSAWAMAKEIADGFLLVTERNFRRLSAAEISKLGFEIERQLRSIRGEQPPLDDIAALQARNRKIQRLNGALQVLRAFRMKHRL